MQAHLGSTLSYPFARSHVSEFFTLEAEHAIRRPLLPRGRKTFRRYATCPYDINIRRSAGESRIRTP